MPSTIIEAEQHYHNLLPLKRLTQRPPTELIAAAKAWSDLVWEEAQRVGPMPLSTDLLGDGLGLAKHPVFICGVHRSGTTLVRNLLDGHPDLVVLPSEGTFYTNLEHQLNTLPENERMTFLGKEWLRRLVNPINQPPYWLLGRSSEYFSPYVDFARYFIAWWDVLRQKENTQWPHTAVVLAYASCTNNIKAKYWVDKTPVNERFIKRIWHEMSSAKIIHVVRNPLNIMASRKQIEPGISFRNALRDMKMSFDVADSYQNDNRFMMLRYEELCDQPKSITAQMASFLTISPSGTLEKPTVGNMAAQPNSSYHDNSANEGKIVKLSHAPSPDILSNDELKWLKAYMGRAAGRLNYPSEKQNRISSYYYICKFRFFLYFLISYINKM